MTLQINLKQIKPDSAANNQPLAWSNTANSWIASSNVAVSAVTYADGSRQTNYVDPIAMAIALG
jgi:hypothetical protein